MAQDRSAEAVGLLAEAGPAAPRPARPRPVLGVAPVRRGEGLHGVQASRRLRDLRAAEAAP